MTGKEKCHLLRQIRREIAKANDIPYQPDDCQYQGDDCIGTCPKCDAEIRALDTMLNRKAARGEKITLAGVSLDTYQETVKKPEEDLVLEWDAWNDGETGAIEMPPWPDTPGIMMEVTPGGMEPISPETQIRVQDLGLPTALENWLLSENIRTAEEVLALMRYNPEKIRAQGSHWYFHLERELSRRGLDVRDWELMGDVICIDDPTIDL